MLCDNLEAVDELIRRQSPGPFTADGQGGAWCECGVMGGKPTTVRH